MVESRRSVPDTQIRFRNAAFGVVALLAAGTALNVYQDQRDVGSAFSDRFADDGSCLDQTPFDPDSGAALLEREIAGQDVLTVVPEHANSYEPSVLNFVVTHPGILEVDFGYADPQTGGAVAGWCG